jgi:hypothetical protein
MQKDFGLAEDMKAGLTAVLQDKTKPAQDRAKEVAGLIGEVLQLVG